MRNKIKIASDLQGLIRIITDSTICITNLVEDMHNRILEPSFLPSTPIQHLIRNIAGITYKNIKRGARIIGNGLDKTLGQLAPVLGEIKVTSKREAIQAVLNGIIGDYLEEKENPLKITMQFRHQSKTLVLNKKSLNKTYPTINGKVLFMVHGLCMNDIQWTRNEHNHGTALAKDLDKTPVYLYYNSGRHISKNGQNFNDLIEELVQNWPVPIEDITIIAHSMGGLVAKSALYYGLQKDKTWTKHLKKIVFLGTPHHGAPLEKIGNYLNVILESIPYTKPFAQLGKIRSAGITDLRYGNFVDEDWEGYDRFELKEDQRKTITLPKNIKCYCVAAITEKATGSVFSQIIGDGLVNVKSALGKHKNPAKNLHFKNTYVAYKNNHLDLLNDLKIYTKIKEWLIYT